MTHMWLGLENPDGLFYGTHQSVSVDAPGEHVTFEDGSGGHHGHTSVPEPSFVLGILTIGAFGLLGAHKRFPHQ